MNEELDAVESFKKKKKNSRLKNKKLQGIDDNQ